MARTKLSFALFVTLGAVLSSVALAQNTGAPEVALNPVTEPGATIELLENYGKTVPIDASKGLGETLYWAGLVGKTTKSVEVNAKLMNEFLAVKRFFEMPRYKVGDRIFVETPQGSSPRAEIKAINPDGTYRVLAWDKLKSLKIPDFDWRGSMDPMTGDLRSPIDKTLVEVVDLRTGQKTQVLMERPWLERPNAKEITLTHEQVAKINDRAAIPRNARYELFSYVVDPTCAADGKPQDYVLRERVDKALAYVDKMIETGALDLRLPENPAARPRAIEKIVAAQKDIIRTVWTQNEMEYLRGQHAQDKWNAAMADPLLKEGYRHKVGAQLKAQTGVCSDQTAGITSVLREAGRKAGFDLKPLQGAVLEGGGHAFLIVRLADGKSHLMDPSWHSVSSYSRDMALESLDLATYDTRQWSNRHINSFAEKSINSKFIPIDSAEGQARLRGYTDRFVEMTVGTAVAREVADGKISQRQIADRTTQLAHEWTSGTRLAATDGFIFKYAGSSQALSANAAKIATEAVKSGSVKTALQNVDATLAQGAAAARRSALDNSVRLPAGESAANRPALAGSAPVLAGATTAVTALAVAAQPKPVANVLKSKAVSSMKGHALGAANFGTALFLKELMVAAETRNLDGITALGHEMATPRFWAAYGAFCVGARASQVGFEKFLAQSAPKILRGVLRSNIALAGGLLVMELVNGTFEPKRFAVTFGSLFVASTIVHAVKWALIGGLVFTGPVGWAILAVDLAVTLYLAGKMEHAFWNLFAKKESSPSPGDDSGAESSYPAGIVEQLERIGAEIE